MDIPGLLKQIWMFVFVCVIPVQSSIVFASGSVSSPADTTDLYGYLYIGDNAGDSNSQKLETVNYKGGGPYEWGIGIGRYLTDTVSVEGTFEYWGERYERKNGVSVPGTGNNIIQGGGLGLSASVIFNFTRGDLHSYVGAGAGYFLTGILITRPGDGLLTDEGAPSDKALPGYHALIGVDYRIEGNHKLGIELKRRILKADFDQYTDGEVDFGGSYLLLMYRHSPK